MRAAQIREYGSPDVIQIVELPDGDPGPGQLAIDVRAAGMNFSDLLQRSGVFPGPGFPFVLGHEVGGMVESVGPGVRDPAPGSRVVTRLPVGGYATRAVVPAAGCISVPDGVELEAALALLSQGMTAAKLAWLLVDAKPGVSVLVHGAGGGVGTLLVQLLKEAGSWVVAAAGSREKLELAQSLGADTTVNYFSEDWVEQVIGRSDGGVDYVLASAGGEQGDRSFDALRPGGTLIMFGGSNMTASELSQQRLKNLVFGNKRLVGFSAAGYRPEMDEDVQRRLFASLCDKKLQVVVGNRYLLSDAAQAHRDMESRTTHGKLVLVP